MTPWMFVVILIACLSFAAPAEGQTCPVCPTPNSLCTPTVVGHPTALQNHCLYPSSQGCNPVGWKLTTAGGGPCCVSTSSPVIVDVDGSGYSLTSAQNGVKFDFFDTGDPVQIAWIALGSTNAWLVLDPNDGPITSADQMFGNLTPQPPNQDPNGFLALAQYDQNGDGWIDSKDAIWTSLRLWQDTNHNGVTDPGELHTLESLGIVGIRVKYRLSSKTDQYGNQFRYVSKARIMESGTEREVERIYDVILQDIP